jgi:hypothetical protein
LIPLNFSLKRRNSTQNADQTQFFIVINDVKIENSKIYPGKKMACKAEITLESLDVSIFDSNRVS